PHPLPSRLQSAIASPSPVATGASASSRSSTSRRSAAIMGAPPLRCTCACCSSPAVSPARAPSGRKRRCASSSRRSPPSPWCRRLPRPSSKRGFISGYGRQDPHLHLLDDLDRQHRQRHLELQGLLARSRLF